jgi:hypothetical protein
VQSTPDQPTQFQKLAECADVTGYTFKLRFMEEVNKVLITDQKVAVSFTCYELRERGNGWLVADKGVRLVVSERDELSGRWTEPKSLTVWKIDPDFVPYEVDTPRGKTPREYNERTAREIMAYRPGNGSRFGQRDSHARQLQY